MPVESFLDAHIALTIERLEDATAATFLVRLRDRLNRRYPLHVAAFSQPKTIVDWVAARNQLEVQKLFQVVRQALLDVDKERNPNPVQRAGAEHAAIALFCLAACRLVDQTAHAALGGKDYVVRAPRSENVIYAVIATALFGGKLQLVSDEARSAPSASASMQ